MNILTKKPELLKTCLKAHRTVLSQIKMDSGGLATDEILLFNDLYLLILIIKLR